MHKGYGTCLVCVCVCVCLSVCLLIRHLTFRVTVEAKNRSEHALANGDQKF